VKYRHTPVMYKSSPLFLYLICAGLILCCASIYAWFGSPTEGSCNIRSWFGHLGFIIAFSALLAKNWRLWKLFTVTELKIITLKNNILLAYVAAMSAYQIIVLIVWVSSDPLKPSSIPNDSGTDTIATCHSDHATAWNILTFVYDGVLLLAGVVLSFRTRKLPHSYKEAQWIAYTTYHLLFSGIFIPIAFGLSKYGTASTYIATCAILFALAGAWSFIFLPKFYIMLVHPEKNVEDSIISKNTGHFSGRITGNSTNTSTTVVDNEHLTEKHQTELSESESDSAADSATISIDSQSEEPKPEPTDKKRFRKSKFSGD